MYTVVSRYLEYKKAREDVDTYGVGFVVNGEHVTPDKVMVFSPMGHWLAERGVVSEKITEGKTDG